MSNDFDILPPDEPGTIKPIKKQSIFSKIFKKTKDNKVNKLNDLNETELNLPKPVKNTNYDPFENLNDNEFQDDLQETKIDNTSKSLKIEDIREKLGLSEIKSAKSLYDQLHETANKDIDKEEQEYDANFNEEQEQQETTIENSKTNFHEFEETSKEKNNESEFTQEIPDKFAFEIPEHDFSKDIDLKNQSKVEQIDDTIVNTDDLKATDKINKTFLEEDFKISKFQLPKDKYDEGLLNDSKLLVEKDLSKFEKEFKTLTKDLNDLILQKKRKNLENVFILPNKKHLNSIESLLKFTKNKETYQEFKDSILTNKKTFTSWINNLLKTQKETEVTVLKELFSRINKLNEYYLIKLDNTIKKYTPIKLKQLNDLKQKENNLKNKINYVIKYSEELNKLNKTLLNEKNKAIKEKELFEKKEQDLKEFYNKKFNEFNDWSKQQKLILDNKQNDFEKESTKIKEELLQVKNEYLNLKKFYENEFKKLKPSLVKLHKEEHTLDSRKETISKTLEEQENKLIEKINYNESILASLAKEKQELNLIKAEIDQGGFSNYLNKKLSNIPEDDQLSLELDMQLRHTNVISPNSAEINNIYDLINTCREHLENQDFKSTKETYNQIHDMFQNLKLSKDDKQQIHTELRELYDDINLKLLEEEAMKHLF